MATLREISQTGKKALWKKDKQTELASLEDYQFFTFSDLDYMNNDKTILATFENFGTEDVIQTNGIKSIVNDNLEPPYDDANRVRLYYYPAGTDLSDIENPIVGTDTINSTELSISIFQPGNYESVFPGYNVETLAKIEYPIYEIGSIQLYTVDFTIEDCILVSGSGTIEHPANTDIVVGQTVQDAAIPDGATVGTIVDDEHFTLADGDEATMSTTHTLRFRNNITYLQHYVILKNHLEDENGIQWNEEEFSQIVPSVYQWEVVQEAIFEEAVVINDARFWDLDKKFRGDL
jgi:hypothetical protein